jgi:glycopeptide antibiotics resistance protein
MKTISKVLLALYLIVLLWLVLFKFSFDVSGVLLDHQARSLSLIPFAEYSQANVREMIDNLIIFVPFGLLLGVNFKKTRLWEKLTYIGFFSLSVEALQFLLAIGVTDITDIIMNTLGGFVGLILYDVNKKYINNEKLDRFIVIVGIILLIALILLRTLVLRVKY